MSISPLKRTLSRLLVVCVCAVLGAAANVAVAWSVAIYDSKHPYRVTMEKMNLPEDTWPFVWPSEWRPRDEWAKYRGAAFGISTEGFIDQKESGSGCMVVAYYLGWPARSLGHWNVFATGLETHSAWVVKAPLAGRVWLPMRPLWPGFVLSTLFYAALAWGLWQMPLHLRRRHRRVHNRCVRCGYSRAGLGEGAACPECGASAK